MYKARISGTEEIVRADELLKLYPNYRELIFVCIDDQCSVRMAPACLNVNNLRKPHFKKYRTQDHTDDCEYALSKLYEKGRDQRLSTVEIKKIGYPSVFDVREDTVEESMVPKNSHDEEDEGVTGRNDGANVMYEFDPDNIRFDRRNRVKGIDRIVKFYLDFPHNRDAKIEVNGNPTEYRFLFKRIENNTDPSSLKKDRIFYGRIILSKVNRDVFSRYSSSVYIKLLSYKNTDPVTGKLNNFSVKIDKKATSNYSMSRLKNTYETMFEKAILDFQSGINDPKIGLYVFLYGTVDEKNDSILNVEQNHITFRYDEVRRTDIR